MTPFALRKEERIVLASVLVNWVDTTVVSSELDVVVAEFESVTGILSPEVDKESRVTVVSSIDCLRVVEVVALEAPSPSCLTAVGEEEEVVVVMVARSTDCLGDDDKREEIVGETLVEDEEPDTELFEELEFTA